MSSFENNLNEKIGKVAFDVLTDQAAIIDGQCGVRVFSMAV